MKTVKTIATTFLFIINSFITIAQISVDIYQNTESGNTGDLLTPEIMNASSYGGCGEVKATWDFRYAYLNHMWVSDQNSRQIPGEIIVDGVNRNTGGNHSWRFRNREENHYVQAKFGTNQWGAPYHNRMTIACYFTTDQTEQVSNSHDNIEVGGNQSFGVLQTIGKSGSSLLYLSAHSCTEGWVTTVSPTEIQIESGKTYWVNLHYDGIAGKVKVAVFDPDNDYKQVGKTATAQSITSSSARSSVNFGRCSPHGNWPDNETYTYLDHIIIDFTNASFPLIPGISTDVSTYWVSPDGQASWQDAENDTPLEGTNCCNLNTANANAQNGNLIYLRSGTYTGQTIEPDNSGISDYSRITYSNYNDEVVNIEESYGINIVKQSYITVNGINFNNMRRFLSIYAGSYNIIRYCNFDGRHYESGAWQGGHISYSYNDNPGERVNSTYNRIHNCSFYRWVYGNYDQHRGALLDIGASSPSSTDGSGYNLFEDNIFAYGGHHTLGVYSKYNVIRNNYFHNETNSGNWNFEGYRATLTEGPSAGSCLWEGNRIGPSGASGLSLRSSDNIVRLNTFHDGGIQVVANIAAVDDANNNYIYNNSNYHNGYNGGYSGFMGGMYFSSWGGESPLENIVKNNIFYDNANGAISYDGQVEPQIIENNWGQDDVDPGYLNLSNNLTDNPNLPDFHLKEDSPCIDAGAYLTTITETDGSGTEFTVEDARYFMDGWGIIEGDKIQLHGQSETAIITNVDYNNNIISIDKELTWTQNLGISLAYVSSAPDIGAYEYGESSENPEPVPEVIPDTSFQISNIYPNPLNTETRIAYNIQESGYYKINIYNFHGQLVKTLLNEEQQAGFHEVFWKGDNNSRGYVSNGVYYLKIISERSYKFAKIVVMR